MDPVNPDINAVPINAGGTHDALDVDDLFDQGVQDDTLTSDAVQSLRQVNLNHRIRPALGVDIERLAASQMVLVAGLIDDSASIRATARDEHGHDVVDEHGNRVTNAMLMREAQNTMRGGVLTESRGGQDITCHVRYLNPSIPDPTAPNGMTDILCNYVLLDQVPILTEANYDPRGQTPLYDQMAVLLATVQAETQRYINLNMPCRSIVYIITDGADYGSRTHNPRTIRPIVQSMLAQEMNIISAMGIQDDQGTNFRDVFTSCGIPDEWIITPRNTPSEIRRAFGLYSRSVSRASRTAGGAVTTTSQVRNAFQWDS